jgi:hypothetical protein
VWYFINSLRVFKAFPDSIIFAERTDFGDEYGWVASTTHHKYWVDEIDGTLQSKTGFDRNDLLNRLEQTVDSLQEYWDEFEKLPSQTYSNVVPVSNNLILLVKHTPDGRYDHEALLDANGNTVLDNLDNVSCYDGLLEYVQDGYYRQWGVPLMGRYQFNTEYANKFQGKFIESRGCFRHESSLLAHGIFREDGTCVLPIKCGQKVEYAYGTGLYLVEYDGRKDFFDAGKGLFLPAVSRFLPYWNEHESNYSVPNGYLWLNKGNMRGLVRIADGVAFFKEE